MDIAEGLERLDEMDAAQTQALLASVRAEADRATDAEDERYYKIVAAELVGHLEALTTGGQEAAVVASTATATRLPSSVRLSTAVIGADEPRHDPPTDLGPRCQICRTAFRGIRLVGVKAAGGEIQACQRCRRRKGLAPA